MSYRWKRFLSFMIAPGFIGLAFGYAVSRITDFAGSGNALVPAEVVRDWGTIKDKKVLTVLTDNSSTGYFLYKGRPMGFEYELLQAFADAHNLKLEIRIAGDMDRIFDQLHAGEADVAAANLTVTTERLRRVNFTVPLLETRQVLVQRKPDSRDKRRKADQEGTLIRNPLELAGKKVYVRKFSSFYERLRNLSEETGNKIRIVEAPGHFETETLIDMVSRGEIDYTIADENVALINQTYHPNLDVSTAISFSQKIAWAVRKTSPVLEGKLNTWLNKFTKTRRFANIYNRYYVDSKAVSQRAESRLFTPRSGMISEFDSTIKINANRLGWDWRYLASLIYQESRFNHEAKSWAGAVGIMQMMPATARSFGVDTNGGDPIDQIRAGTNFLIRLDKMWQKTIKDPEERRKFVMASYNVGPGHVIDAKKLAKKFGKDETKWKNVSVFLFLKSQPRFYTDPVVTSGYCRGSEPCRYVAQIHDRFEHYKNLAN